MGVKSTSSDTTVINISHEGLVKRKHREETLVMCGDVICSDVMHPPCVTLLSILIMLLLMTESYACSHVNIQSGLTSQGKGVGTFYTLGGSCNFNSRLYNLVPRPL